MTNKRSERVAYLVLGLFVASFFGLLLLMAWAAKQDIENLESHREAIRLMARVEWLRAADQWSDHAEHGQSVMDFVPERLRENAIAREAIEKAKGDTR